MLWPTQGTTVGRIDSAEPDKLVIHKEPYWTI